MTISYVIKDKNNRYFAGNEKQYSFAADIFGASLFTKQKAENIIKLLSLEECRVVECKYEESLFPDELNLQETILDDQMIK